METELIPNILAKGKHTTFFNCNDKKINIHHIWNTN
jgi:hypothetical protein